MRFGICANMDTVESKKRGLISSIIRFLEHIHLGQWIIERLEYVLEHLDMRSLAPSVPAGALAAILAWILSVPYWVAIVIGLLAMVAILFCSVPRLKVVRPDSNLGDPTDMPSLRDHYESAMKQVVEFGNEANECRDKLKKSTDGLTQAAKIIDDFQKADIARGHLAQLSGTVWLLKSRAREIRRAWPNADFNKRPMYLQSWLPAPDSDQICPWLSLATEWRKDMLRLSYIERHSDASRNTMDFDEVMEMLDDAERFAKGQNPLRTIFSSGSPDVQITRWGIRDATDRGNFGFFLRNQGDSASHILVSPPTPIGLYNLASDTRTQPLLDAHGETHLRARLSQISNSHAWLLANTLPEMISQLPANDNGVVVAPILRLVYQDGNGHWYGSKHELISTTAADGSRSLLIAYRYRELLTMPPWMPN